MRPKDTGMILCYKHKQCLICLIHTMKKLVQSCKSIGLRQDQHLETCQYSNEILNHHPMSLHVKLMDSDTDDPTFTQIMSGDPKELPFW